MAMLACDDSAFDSELEKLGLVIKQTEQDINASVELIKRGRGNITEVPHEVRALVAQESLSGARAKDVAKAFNVSESSVSAYKNGATSTTSYNKPDEELAKVVKNTRLEIGNTAQKKLIEALNEITPDKLAGAKLRDIASVAKDMASVVKDMTPEDSSKDDAPKVNFVFYRPRMRNEDEYEVIDVPS